VAGIRSGFGYSKETSPKVLVSENDSGNDAEASSQNQAYLEQRVTDVI